MEQNSTQGLIGDYCKPVQSDKTNWYSTADIMYNSGDYDTKSIWTWGLNWQLGDDLLVPIVRLTDAQVSIGIPRVISDPTHMVEQYDGTMPANIECFVELGNNFIDSMELINVDEWADYSNQKILIGNFEIAQNPTTNDNTLENSLAILIKTVKPVDPSTSFKILLGIRNSSNHHQKSIVCIAS